MKKPIERKKIKDQCNICIFPINNCICQPFWSSFDSIFDKKYNGTMDVSELRISTITFGFKLKNTSICLDTLSRNFKKTLFTRSIEFKKNSKKSTKNLNLNYNFYNQCSIKCFIPHEKYRNQLVKVSVKIFHNGSFNVTGARSIKGIVHVIREIIKTLNSYDNVLVYEKPLKIIDTNISMINTDFNISKKIKQKLLCDILNDSKFSIKNNGNIKRVTFDPDSYHGVKIKYVNSSENSRKKESILTRKGIEKMNGELSILVFNTGNIIITGGKTAEETYNAYIFINDIFENFSNEILRENPEKKKQKKRKIYLKSEEYNKLKKEKLHDSEKEVKKQVYSLKCRTLVEMKTQKHQKTFGAVLLEITNIHR